MFVIFRKVSTEKKTFIGTDIRNYCNAYLNALKYNVSLSTTDQFFLSKTFNM